MEPSIFAGIRNPNEPGKQEGIRGGGDLQRGWSGGSAHRLKECKLSCGNENSRASLMM